MARPIQEEGLDARITTDRGRSRVLAGWRWLDIVLAVYSQSLHDLKDVLFMFVRVSVSRLKERS